MTTRIEAALAAILQGHTHGAAVLAGQSAAEKSLPCVVCAVESSEPFPPGSGNERVEVSVTAASSADEPDAVAAHAARTAAVRARLLAPGLAALVSGHGGILCHLATHKGARPAASDRAFVDALSLSLVVGTL